MVDEVNALRVVCAGSDRYPQAFWWYGQLYRVLGLEGLHVVGRERRYRLATAQGSFELALAMPTGDWRVRRMPGWLDRVLARLAGGPRYPLPVWRRRHYWAAGAGSARRVSVNDAERQGVNGGPCLGVSLANA
jgi:hypothetical protein